MSNFDDEFKNVKKGLPEEKTPQKTGVNYVSLFTIVGILFALAIILFQDVIFYQGEKIDESGNFILEQIILNGILAMLVGSVQAWMFKARIKSRIYMFVAFSIVGGVAAGFIGGFLINSGFLNPFIIGMISGAVIGGISSVGQNMVMNNTKHGVKWLQYSVISWAIIFSIGWTIGWQPKSAAELALAVIFLMVASGISLVVFLNNTPEIEFS
jgi:hypothetical protein